MLKSLRRNYKRTSMGPFLLESFEMKRPRKALSSIFIANEILLFFSDGSTNPIGRLFVTF